MCGGVLKNRIRTNTTGINLLKPRYRIYWLIFCNGTAPSSGQNFMLKRSKGGHFKLKRSIGSALHVPEVKWSSLHVQEIQWVSSNVQEIQWVRTSFT
jgi:hypothetical protein